jgi:ABC-type multidrug transport system fused ATPase/permease subunit
LGIVEERGGLEEEKQCICRAFLKNSKIILINKATSTLGTTSSFRR